MRCHACGQENLDTATSCKLCGNRLYPGYQYQYQPMPQADDGKVERAIMWLVIVLIIVVVIAIVAGILFWMMLTDEMRDLSPWSLLTDMIRTGTCF